MSNRMKCGPSGGIDGDDFLDAPPPDDVRITAIHVWHGSWIDAIQIHWSDSKASPKHGGDGGENKEDIFLADDEHLVGIYGKYGEKVDSIGFVTNKRVIEPLGGDGGDVEFHYNAAKSPLTNIDIVGFCGRAGDYIYAIGCIFSVEK